MTRTNPDTGLNLKAALEAGRTADRLRRNRWSNPSDLVTLVVDGEELHLPARALAQLVEILDDLAEGRASAVAPADLLVGTEEAARVLGVSRPWVAELIDRGDLEGTRVGSKRRVRLGDLVEQRREIAARQLAAADALAAIVDEDERSVDETLKPSRVARAHESSRRRSKPKSVA